MRTPSDPKKWYFGSYEFCQKTPCFASQTIISVCLFVLVFFLKFNFYLKEKLVQVCFEMFVDIDDWQVKSKLLRM
jgi:hypothetical protein